MGRRVWGLWLVASLFAVAGISACRQLVGITDNPPEDLVTSICGLPYGTNVCASCVNTNCCTESTACAADPGCAAYQSCLGKCNGDPGCRSQCIGDNPVGTSGVVSALSSCLVSNCEPACRLTCGSIGASIAPPDAGASCETCLESKAGACTPARACGSSVDCQAYAQCLHAFTTPDWLQACATEHDAGATLYALLDEVASAGCATECAYGQDWRCVGHVTWPTPVATMTNVIIEKVHDVFGNPIANAKYSACGALNEDSQPCIPVVSGVTDDAGYLAIRVPTVQANSTTLMGVEGWGVASAPDYLSTYVYSLFPLSQSVLTFAPGVSIFLETAAETAETAYAGLLDGGIQTPNTGSVLAVVFDCQWHPAPGVHVTTDKPSLTAYYLSPQLQILAPDSGTSSSGIAFFVNVPVGNLTLTATPLGLRKAGNLPPVYVNPSAWTGVQFGPQP